MTPMEEVQRFKFDIMRTMPFYGDILMRIPINPNKDIMTAQTDGRKIEYNPRFFKSLEPGEINFILMHEVLHILLFHKKRRGDRNPQYWNVACDLVVNEFLLKLAYNIYHAGVPFSRPKDGLFGLRADSDTITVENLYEKICIENSKRKGASQKIIVSLKTSPWLEAEENKIVPPDDLEISLNEENGEDKTELEELFIKEIIRNSAEKNRGTMGSIYIPNAIYTLTASRNIRWQSLLRDFLTAEISEDTSYATPERKYIHMDLIIPGHCMSEEKIGNVWAFVDSSGSIDNDEMNQFLTQLYRISKEFQSVLNIAYWDTEVTDVYKGIANKNDILNCVPHHSGGTDINCIYNWMKNNHVNPDVMLILTDGYFGKINTESFKKSFARKTVLVLSPQAEIDSDMKKIGRIASL